MLPQNCRNYLRFQLHCLGSYSCLWTLTMAMICILSNSLQISALWSVGSKRGQRTSDVLSKGNQLLLQGVMDASVIKKNLIFPASKMLSHYHSLILFPPSTRLPIHTQRHKLLIVASSLYYDSITLVPWIFCLRKKDWWKNLKVVSLKLWKLLIPFYLFILLLETTNYGDILGCLLFYSRRHHALSNITPDFFSKTFIPFYPYFLI